MELSRPRVYVVNFRLDHGGTWQAIYVDGVLREEDEQLSVELVLQALDIDHDLGFARLHEEDSLPDSESEARLLCAE